MIHNQPWLDLQNLDSRQRLAYHAGCSFAANHLAVLFAIGVKIFQQQNLARDASEKALGVLMQSALHNLLMLGVPQGVSGPVARKDWNMVQAHAGVLADKERELYETLSKQLEQLLYANNMPI